MKVKFQFNSKSSGQGVPEAISLTKKCNGSLDNKFYVIEFDSPQDKNLWKFFDLVGNLKGSVIEIDDGEPINAVKFFHAVNCQDKLLCKGICKHLNLGYYSIDEFVQVNLRNIEDNILKTTDANLIRYLNDFLEPISENCFKLNKELLIEYAKIEMSMEEQFCEKYDFEKLRNTINSLPSKVELISSEDLYEEDYEEESSIFDLLSECPIDNKLPFKDILRCSKVISLLPLARIPIRVVDSDINLYSLPDFKSIILLKIKELNDDQTEDIDPIIIKENNFYKLRISSFELYFQIFEESDSTIEEYFKKLKLL